MDDADRIGHLRDHIGAVARAVADGVDVRGYFVRSLIDNGEWAEGFTKRFGLVRVDYESGSRTPKASYDWFRDLVQRHP